MRGIPVRGDLIRDTRRMIGLTQEQLAAQADCDVKTLRKAEKSGQVDQSTVERIAHILGMTNQSLIHAAYLSQEQANTQLIRDWQAAFNRRDPAALAELFHKDGSVTVFADVPLPGGGAFLGKEGVFQWAKLCFDNYITQQITPEMMQINVLGELAYMSCLEEIEVTSVQTQLSAKATAINEFRIRDGKILSLRIITNTAAISAILPKCELNCLEEPLV